MNRWNFLGFFIILVLLLFLISCPVSKIQSGNDTKESYSGCKLSVNISGSGTIDKVPDKQYYPTKAKVSLTALPKPGFAFDHWEGDINSSVNSVDICMNTDKSVTAVFTESTSTFDLSVNTIGLGTVVKDPDQSDYLTGTTVTLMATPDTGYVFDHWSGDLSGSANPVAINVHGGNKTVTAVFIAIYYLSVSTLPDNSGDIIIDPDQPVYKDGTSVSITALPKPGYAFASWSGDQSGTANPITIIMNSNKLITANFEVSIARYTLNTAVTGPGNVLKSPDQTDYLTGTTVLVNAVPDAGCMFDHWEGDVGGSANPLSINMNSVKNITAVFIGQRGNLSGSVVESIGGYGVSNALITVNGTNKTAISDENGLFSINNIPIGTYDVFVSKIGNAGSKLQSVTISNGFTAKVEMVDAVYDFSPSLTTPPTISVSGITKGSSYPNTSSVSITVNVTAGSCQVIGNSNHSSIYLKVGSSTNLKEDSYSSSDTLSYSLPTYYFPPGPIDIRIVSYDINNNRSELVVPISISGSSGTKPSVKPDKYCYDIEADTFSSSLEILKQKNYSFDFAPMRSSNLPYSSIQKSAYINSTVLVKFWLFDYGKYYGSYETDGIVITRSSSSGGTYTEVGKTKYSIYSSGYYFYYIADYSSQLTQGQTYWYKIAYYNEYGIGPYSDPISVLILPIYNLDLVSPSNGSAITNNSPTLTWVTGAIANATRYDWIQVRDILSNTVVYETPSDTPMTNATSFKISSLAYNKQYEWDIIQSIYQYINSDYVYSISLPSSGGNSSNGAYTFSVVKQ